jgi:hypothetical protein
LRTPIHPQHAIGSRASIEVVAKEIGMKVKRVVANMAASDPALAKRFYQQILSLDVLMDRGWIATYGSRQRMTVQISFLSEGGSGAPVPDLSIEVDDLDAALARMTGANIPIESGPGARALGRAPILRARSLWQAGERLEP